MIILNKTDFNLLAGVPLYGVESWGPGCLPEDESERSDDQNEFCYKVVGPDADAVAIAVYHMDGIPYAAVGQKTGQFIL